MIDIVINYEPTSKDYKVYEPTTDTLLVSKNLTEALVNLSHFLISSNLVQNDLITEPEISYHLDSHTMKAMIESNVNLLKRLQQAPSGFMLANQKFGGSTSTSSASKKSNNENFGKSASTFTPKKSSSFSGESGFKKANKKFGSR